MRRVLVYRKKKKTFYFNSGKPAEIGTVREWADGELHKKTPEGCINVKRDDRMVKD